MTSQEINRCFMRFEDRAERITAKQVAETFVSVGPLMDLLGSRNNQIMYGRRGTGKTHALRYFHNQMNAGGDVAVYIDAQNIGSNGSIYNDGSLPIEERATRLLIDVCSSIHAELLDVFTDPARGWNLAEAAPLLDHFADGLVETRIEGIVESEQETKLGSESGKSSSIGASLAADPSMSFSFGHESKGTTEDTNRSSTSGLARSWIDFSHFSRAVRSLATFIAPRRLWVLIDEWTTIPHEIQPYLADLLRRAMFSVANISVKIAAIEHRANFKVDRPDEGYIGFELGADISAGINLDDYLVIDNDEARATEFFRTFITNHSMSVASEIKVDIGAGSKIIQTGFTQDNVFTEFVRATEGVPRDAMHILSLAAQKANASPISMPIVRTAASTFFQAEKYNAIASNPENRLLLDWIRDEVIGSRRTRAFLLPVGSEDVIIDRLFDRRALHILNRNRSAAHRPGERFVVYKLDYGLYVDLSATDKFPEDLLVQGGDVDFEVPVDDARSYRRAILNLDSFYERYPEFAST